MDWKFLFYDWGGLNLAIFEFINAGTPAELEVLAWLFSILGSYWTAPMMLAGMWLWSRSASNPARGTTGRHRLIVFSVAFSLALVIAGALKLWLDFPRPPAVLGDMVRVIGAMERHYSLPSGHATYAALVVGAIWPMVGYRGRIGLLLYAALVAWSRIAAGMHFPADVCAGLALGLGCTILGTRLLRFARSMEHSATSPAAWVWFTLAATIVMADQLSKSAIVRTFVYGEQVAITQVFNLVYVLNPGAAFSFLANAGGWQRYFFIGLGLVVSAGLGRVLCQRPPRLEALGYSLILGGALGNVVDRLLRGQVVDFLDFHWNLAHWPAFNFADVTIFSGAALLIVHMAMQVPKTDPR